MPPLTAREGMAPHKSELKGSRRMQGQPVGAFPARRTLLSTSPTKEWTRITWKKEVNVPSRGRRTHRATFPIHPPSKEDGKKNTIMLTPFYPDVLFIQGRLELAPSPTMSLPCKGTSLHSVKHGDGGTNAITYDDIMKLENGIRHSPYPVTEP